MAELAFFERDSLRPAKGVVIGTNGSYRPGNAYAREAVFDGDLLTFFDAPDGMGGWVGMDFGHPIDVGRITAIMRGDGNEIEIGNEYELFFWQDGGWRSLGLQTASVPTTWQEQMECAKKSTRAVSAPIRLRSYTYQGVIASEKEIAELLDELFADDVPVVQYKDRDRMDFILIPMREVGDAFASVKSQLKAMLRPGMERVLMEWDSVSLGWNGTGFTISSGGTGATGTEAHKL